MNKEDKDLLLKDLCARLPYGVKCKVYYIINNETTYGENVDSECIDIIKRISFNTYSVYTEWLGYESVIEDIKPYLRPLSSMTEEEIKELLKIDIKRCIFSSRHLTWHLDGEVIDHLNKKMIDWRGLIEKGLALEAPKDMYNN